MINLPNVQAERGIQTNQKRLKIPKWHILDSSSCRHWLLMNKGIECLLLCWFLFLCLKLVWRSRHRAWQGPSSQTISESTLPTIIQNKWRSMSALRWSFKREWMFEIFIRNISYLIYPNFVHEKFQEIVHA